MYFLTTLIEECYSYMRGGPPALTAQGESSSSSEEEVESTSGVKKNYDPQYDDAFIDYTTLICDDNCWSDIFVADDPISCNGQEATDESKNSTRNMKELEVDDTTYHCQPNDTSSTSHRSSSKKRFSKRSLTDAALLDQYMDAMAQKEQDALAQDEYLERLSQEIQAGTSSFYFYDSTVATQDCCQEEDESFLSRLDKEIKAGSFYFFSAGKKEEKKSQSRKTQSKDEFPCASTVSTETTASTGGAGVTSQQENSKPGAEHTDKTPQLIYRQEEPPLVALERHIAQTTPLGSTADDGLEQRMEGRPFDEGEQDDNLRPFDEDPMEAVSDPPQELAGEDLSINPSEDLSQSSLEDSFVVPESSNVQLPERSDKEGTEFELDLSSAISCSSSLSSGSSKDSRRKTPDSEAPIIHKEGELQHKQEEELDDDQEAARMLVSLNPSKEDDESGQDGQNVTPKEESKDTIQQIEKTLKNVSYDASLFMLKATKAPLDTFQNHTGDKPWNGKSPQKRVRRRRSNRPLPSSSESSLPLPVHQEKPSSSLDIFIAASSSTSALPAIVEVSTSESSSSERTGPRPL